MRPIHPFVVGHVTGAVIVGIAAGSVPPCGAITSGRTLLPMRHLYRK